MKTRGKKPPYVDYNVMKKVEIAIETSSKSPIKTYARDCTVIPSFVGFTFSVHNGKSFIPVTISENMIGYKLGDFALTRTFKKHSVSTKAVKTKTPVGGKKR